MEVMGGCSGQDLSLGSEQEELCLVCRALGCLSRLKSLPPLSLFCLDALVSGIPVLVKSNDIFLSEAIVHQNCSSCI